MRIPQVIIRPQASKTETRQVTKNLLLSKDGEIDPKPELEIYNDDVKASHGATVGSLDETELFYCLSRGLDLTKAKKILKWTGISVLGSIIVLAIVPFLFKEQIKTYTSTIN